jgi:osmotically inducible protein OsmC
MATRTATTKWQGDLQAGSGNVTLDSSGAGEFPVTFASRTEDPQGRTSPEELIAAAHSSCFSMALSAALTRAGTPPESLDVKADVTLGRDEAGLVITEIALTVEGTVPGADDASFQQAAEATKTGCPVSRALASVPSITLKATLRS